MLKKGRNIFLPLILNFLARYSHWLNVRPGIFTVELTAIQVYSSLFFLLIQCSSEREGWDDLFCQWAFFFSTWYLLNGPWSFPFFLVFLSHHFQWITQCIVSPLHLCNACGSRGGTAGAHASCIRWQCAQELCWRVPGIHSGQAAIWGGMKGVEWHLPGRRKLPAVSPTGRGKQCLTSPPAASLR